MELSFYLYFGPTKKFNEQIHKKEKKILKFSQILKAYDLLKKGNQEEASAILSDDYDVLSIKATDYPTLTNAGESSVHEIIESFVAVGYTEVYLQNPTKIIMDNIENFVDVHKESTVETIRYKFPTLTKTKMSKLGDVISSELIGQHHVQALVMSSLYKLYKKRNNKKPVIIMFYGPSGIGKTETAKMISSVFNKENIFRIQLSMYQNNNHYNYLFGGGVSYKSFASDLLKRDSNIILLDEFDKVLPEVHAAFYQMFDEGIYEDVNYDVYLEDSIIICTSNYSSLEEIRVKLGEPLFYRFDQKIKFNDFNGEDSSRVIDNVYDSVYSVLDPSEKKVLDENLHKDKVKRTLLKSNVNKNFNYREIRTIIHESAYTMLWENEFGTKKR